RALEQVLESQIATLDAAGARAEVRGQSIASRLAQESQRMEGLGDNLNAAATRASETIAARMSQENQRVEALGDSLNAAAARAGETIAARLAQENQRVEVIGETLVGAAGRAAQLKSMMESAEGTLKMATQSLDVQAAGFRAAVTTAAEAPHQAAVALDRQATRIAEVADGAASRAEFVLARQEKQRAQLSEMMQRLEQEGER